MMTRRFFAGAGVVAVLSGCTELPQEVATRETTPAPPPLPPLPDHYGPINDEPFPIPAIPEGVIPPRLWRQFVANPFPDDAPGTIVVDPDAGLLHLVEDRNTAMRYGAGTGAAAFGWNGAARAQFWRNWPRWKAPASMIRRRPELERYSVANGGMAPGPDNPLGARALYLFQNGEDTLYRIHGGCAPEDLGKMVSSGCIRLLDHDVIDLEERATHGATVRVLASSRPRDTPALTAVSGTPLAIPTL